MTEVPIDVGYRSYITLMRTKWDIVYHSKDLYFSHANKTLEPFYDMHTKEYYGVETNPTRLAIVSFIDQFRDGPGMYDTENFNDLLKDSINYSKRVKVRKPFRAGRHQSSHPSLLDALRENHYQHQPTKPIVKELTPRKHPYLYSLLVEEHPYEKMIGRIWTHIFVPTPPDFGVLDDLKTRTGYRQWLIEACSEAHDMIIVEPILCQFYANLINQLLCLSKLGLKMMYAISTIYACHRPYKWERNLVHFVLLSGAHFGLAETMRRHPLAKYKISDRFHDSEALNELKYFREFVPAVIHRVVVLFKDVEGQVEQQLRTLNVFHLANLLTLGFNYLYGIDNWVSYRGAL